MMNQMTDYGIKKNIRLTDSALIDSLMIPCQDRWGYI